MKRKVLYITPAQHGELHMNHFVTVKLSGSTKIRVCSDGYIHESNNPDFKKDSQVKFEVR